MDSLLYRGKTWLTVVRNKNRFTDKGHKKQSVRLYERRIYKLYPQNKTKHIIRLVNHDPW